AWGRLLQSHGGISVAALALETGWSERRLSGRFRAEIGLPPKAAARVVRFDRARRLGAARPRLLADLAAEAGYFDQAHLAREFRALAGCPPSQWLAEQGSETYKPRPLGKAEPGDEGFQEGHHEGDTMQETP
ncbi:MAG: helix-turn-helix domain-containing protein, partial [Streptosporangiaceae bacterium]